MRWRDEWKSAVLIVGGFLVLFYLPIETLRQSDRVQKALLEALHLAKWYAKEHVLLCLVPAFFIAGAIAVFVSQASVTKYLGAGAKRVLAYSVASVSGTILAVCSCTVLPLFAGIYRMGAGIGPATAFLYSGPAINVLAIILTARVLGVEIGLARAVGAVVFSVIIGICMHLIFRKEEQSKTTVQTAMPDSETFRPLWQTVLYFSAMVGILVFANWGKPAETSGLWHVVFSAKWIITAFFAVGLGVILVAWFGMAASRIGLVGILTAIAAILFGANPMIPFAVAVVGISIITSTSKGDDGEWFSQAWGFAKQILPLLLLGVLIAGALLGRPDQEGLIPSRWVASLVGGNSLWSNLFASVVGAFMYFATLTEVPILQGLMGSGMGKGPALALLLAGPALSLPNMLVIRSVMGTVKTTVFILLVVLMAAVSGLIYGTLFS
jgi:uncharacterized membrane protein YraQ (UPF0718 family)